MGSYDKADKDAAYNTAKRTHEYWMGVLDVADLGTPDKPELHILRAKRSVYTAVVNRMLDEDVGEDVTKLNEGRPAFLKKTGEKLNTEWHTTWLDARPISEDPAYIEALRGLLVNFDIRSKFYLIKWDELEEIYQELTGESIPESYRAQEGLEQFIAQENASGGSSANTGVPSRKVQPGATKPGPAKAATGVPAKGVVKPAGATKTPAQIAAEKKAAAEAAAAEAEAAAQAEADAAAAANGDPETSTEPDANGITLGVTEVTLVSDGVSLVGLVVKWNEDDQNYDVQVPNGTDTPDIFGCAVEDFTINVPAEPEPEPAPAKPAGPAKKTVSKPAAAAPAKPAPAKGTGVPAKPAGATKPAPSASAGIKARLAK